MPHPRNRHHRRYDFGQLIQDTPELDTFTVANPYGDQSIDFTDATAVKMLNRALLKTYYGVQHWDIPDGYLCPPIPGRADYVHYLADLLARSRGGVIPYGPTVRVLDIGTGANMIYPLIGYHEYGWRFVGSEIDRVALASAQTIIQSNGDLATGIELRRQSSRIQFFKGIVHAGEKFDLTLCNPPFHASQHEALRGSQRKWRGLGKASPDNATSIRNFGGQGNELWCEGGEALFIRRMIRESVDVRNQVHWFSTLVSKESNLPDIYRTLRAIGALDVQTVEMLQGQKRSRFVAWTFFSSHT